MGLRVRRNVRRKYRAMSTMPADLVHVFNTIQQIHFVTPPYGTRSVLRVKRNVRRK